MDLHNYVTGNVCTMFWLFCAIVFSRAATVPKAWDTAMKRDEVWYGLYNRSWLIVLRRHIVGWLVGWSFVHWFTGRPADYLCSCWVRRLDNCIFGLSVILGFWVFYWLIDLLIYLIGLTVALLVGWLVGWMLGWFVGRLISWFFGCWLVNFWICCLAVWLVDFLVSWFNFWLVSPSGGQSVGWLTDLLTGWLLACLLAYVFK